MAGTPPDWEIITIEDLLALAVDAKTLLEALKTGSDKLISTFNTQVSQAQGKLDDLNSLADAAQTAIDDLELNVDSSILSFLTIPASVGGTDAFINTLSAAIDDPNDPDRPQFASADFTGGIVLLIGGAKEEDVQPTVNKLTAILGADLIQLPSITDLISP